MNPITESELYSLYLSGGWDDIYDFPTFMAKCELSGINVADAQKGDIDGLEKKRD